jgi:hypothetical protein
MNIKESNAGGMTGAESKRGRGYIDREPPAHKERPSGPFTGIDEAREGDLLIFVPRNEISRIIDRVTGGYGYSHLAIDCGETDEPTGRPVMIEATMGVGVAYGFQDEYGKRAFVRLPLRAIGVDVRKFCGCVRSRVGEKFDDIEAISLGILDNPARQICSDLATGCLPQDLQEEIARCHTRAVIHPLAAVRNERTGPRSRLFMSPNGFAEFLGAPRGESLKGPDERALPHIECRGEEAGVLERMLKRTDALFRSAWKSVRRG